MATNTLLQKLKTILDACSAANPSVPTYYYREIAEGTTYPKLDCESSEENPEIESLQHDDPFPAFVKAKICLVLIGETPIGTLEDIMGIINDWMHPLVFSSGGTGGGSGTVYGDPVLFKAKYMTRQVPDRSYQGKPLVEVKQEFMLIFGGSFG